MSNPVFEAVRSVLAVRDYQNRDIPDHVIDRIVGACHMTASSMNQQQWHFVVVRDRQALQQLGAFVRTGPYIAGAAAAVVVAYERRNPYGVSDASRAVQSMVLTAWGDGVGSNWTGFGHLEGVRQHVGLPDTYEVLCVVPFGYPKQAVKGRKNRRPLAEVASLGRYGTPYTPESPGE